MWIELLGGLAGQVLFDTAKHSHLCVVEAVTDGLSRGAIACQRQLQGLHGSDQCCGDEVHQRVPLYDLTVFDIEAVGFQRSEQLLDVPAQTIPAYDFKGVSETGDSMRGQQHPAHWLHALGRIDLTYHDDVEANLVGKRSHSARGPI